MKSFISLREPLVGLLAFFMFVLKKGRPVKKHHHIFILIVDHLIRIPLMMPRPRAGKRVFIMAGIVVIAGTV